MNTEPQKKYAVIAAFKRTAFAKTTLPEQKGKMPGHFADMPPVELQVPLINKMLEDTGLDPKHVTEILTGVVHQEYTQGLNMARQIVMHPESDLTYATGGTSIDKFCASSMKGMSFAASLVKDNPNEVYICTGHQDMSNVGFSGKNAQMAQKVQDGNAPAFMDMATTAKNLEKPEIQNRFGYTITPEEKAELAAQSHQRLHRAQESGLFDNEIVLVDGLALDDGVRPETTKESLMAFWEQAQDPDNKGHKKAKAIFDAATSSQITDGASACMIMSESFAHEQGIEPLARIIASGQSGIEPEIMGIAPYIAILNVLEKSGIPADKIDLWEINEAFAVVPLAVAKTLQNHNVHIDFDKLNVNGGAIALGHPLGATGTRIAGHLAMEMQRRNVRYGIAAACIGGGMGEAMLLENPNYTPSI